MVWPLCLVCLLLSFLVALVSLTRGPQRTLSLLTRGLRPSVGTVDIQVAPVCDQARELRFLGITFTTAVEVTKQCSVSLASDSIWHSFLLLFIQHYAYDIVSK